MKKVWKIASIFALLAMLSTTAFGQSNSLDGLKKEREKAEQEIARLDAELSTLASSNKDLQGQLNLYTERLTQRTKVLNSINNQIRLLSTKEAQQSKEATRYSQDIERIKDLYERNLVALHSLRLRLDEGGGMLLCDSLRSEKVYLEHLSTIMLSELSKKNIEVDSLHGKVGDEIRQILVRKEELEVLRGEESVAVAEIKGERAKIEALRRDLGLQSNNLQAKKAKQQEALEELARQIQAIIEAEMRASGEGSVLDIGGTSESFEKLRGAMISPLVGAKVTDSYGVHNHPTQSGIKVDNKGVNLQGLAGGMVRVVAAGEVRKVFNVGGIGTSVLVRHGQYLTVYSSLDVVNVKSGDKVLQGQSIGKVGSNGTLHFEIWRETQTENPAYWIKGISKN